MSNGENLLERFEELEAGRILGDLDAEEQKEWEQLSVKFGATSDASEMFEIIAANLDTGRDDSEIPAGLKEKLKADAASFEKKQAVSPPGPERLRMILTSPLAGWVAALVVAGWLILTNSTTDISGPTKVEKRDSLVGNATDLERADFAGNDTYSGMSGEVVWSSQKQEGYLTLTGLPVNNPEQNQYQLWIVDPTRDKYPVDGGVFDITGDGTLVIPVRNPVSVNEPKAFVITLEQPGGVVVSSQEIVVAIASPS